MNPSELSLKGRPFGAAKGDGHLGAESPPLAHARA